MFWTQLKNVYLWWTALLEAAYLKVLLYMTTILSKSCRLGLYCKKSNQMSVTLDSQIPYIKHWLHNLNITSVKVRLNCNCSRKANHILQLLEPKKVGKELARGLVASCCSFATTYRGQTGQKIHLFESADSIPRQTLRLTFKGLQINCVFQSNIAFAYIHSVL